MKKEEREFYSHLIVWNIVILYRLALTINISGYFNFWVFYFKWWYCLINYINLRLNNKLNRPDLFPENGYNLDSTDSMTRLALRYAEVSQGALCSTPIKFWLLFVTTNFGSPVLRAWRYGELNNWLWKNIRLVYCAVLLVYHRVPTVATAVA